MREAEKETKTDRQTEHDVYVCCKLLHCARSGIILVWEIAHCTTSTSQHRWNCMPENGLFYVRVMLSDSCVYLLLRILADFFLPGFHTGFILNFIVSIGVCNVMKKENKRIRPKQNTIQIYCLCRAKNSLRLSLSDFLGVILYIVHVSFSFILSSRNEQPPYLSSASIKPRKSRDNGLCI